MGGLCREQHALASAPTKKIFAVKLCATDTTLTTLLVPGRYTKGVSYDIPPLLAPNGCPCSQATDGSWG